MSKLDTSASDLILNFIGDTEWHGETYADKKSLENMEVCSELTELLIDKLYRNATLANNAVATFSGKKLNDRAKEMLRNIKDIIDEVEL